MPRFLSYYADLLYNPIAEESIKNIIRVIYSDFVGISARLKAKNIIILSSFLFKKAVQFFQKSFSLEHVYEAAPEYTNDNILEFLKLNLKICTQQNLIRIPKIVVLNV